MCIRDSSRSNLVRIDGEEDVTANLLYLLLYRSWLRLWLRSYIFLLRSWCRSRFLYRLSLLGIALAQVDAYTCQCIEVPVRGIFLLRVVFV